MKAPDHISSLFDDRKQGDSDENRSPEEILRLEKEQADMQYQNLVTQLNPHFLFNSLSTLESLIHRDQQHAVKFLNKLTKVYRYVLGSRENPINFLSEELRFMQDYTELLQTRFGKGLVVRLETAGLNTRKKVVTAALQILVENAVRHNSTDVSCPLNIHIYGQGVYLVVENNLQKKVILETQRREGLTNLTRLYSHLSPIAVEVQETEQLFAVKLPLL